MDGSVDAGSADKYLSNLGLAAIPSIRLSMVIINLRAMGQTFLAVSN